MFGYVMPCKMELKVRDYERFKAYYCGLCHSIKKNFGNIPRVTLNYDMTFLAILLDALDPEKTKMDKFKCALHPTKPRLLVLNNSALDYASQCNIVLTYYKLIDNINDDKAVKSRLASAFLKKHVKDNELNEYIQNSLNTLYNMELNAAKYNIDEISEPFADLTGHLISSYKNVVDEHKELLYWLGYNLGKWIYIIDAWDDLEEDMAKGKHNTLNAIYNTDNLPFQEFKSQIESRVEYTLIACASACEDSFLQLPIKKNMELIYNILQLGLMEKMDIVFKRSVDKNAESL